LKQNKQESVDMESRSGHIYIPFMLRAESKQRPGRLNHWSADGAKNATPAPASTTLRRVRNISNSTLGGHLLMSELGLHCNFSFRRTLIGWLPDVTLQSLREISEYFRIQPHYPCLVKSLASAKIAVQYPLVVEERWPFNRRSCDHFVP